MIADDPKKRPSIKQIEQFLICKGNSFSEDRKITAEDLGIAEDLEVLEECSIAEDVERRADKFKNCPFSTVNIMNSLYYLSSYAELSKAG